MKEARGEHCMVCGEPLAYLGEGVSVRCSGCGRSAVSAIICPSGHYVCDTCHSARPLEQLPTRARATCGQAPEDILEELLTIPGLPMHGPEHHAMAALALLLASERAGTELPGNFVEETIRRAMQIPGGSCGYHGACGGAISLGIAVSMLTGGTPLNGPARGAAHRAAALALLNCADDEARCCKRSLRKTVAAGREFFAGVLGVEFPPPEGSGQCADITRNRECAGRGCPYFPGAGPASLQ